MNIMKNFGRITLLVSLAVLGNAATVCAQPIDRFHRVTTTAQFEERTASNRDSRSSPARDLRSGSGVNRLALATRGSAVRGVASETDVLHPYTSRPAAESQSRESNGGRYSTWREQPESVSRAPQAASLSRSHNYYPGLRSGVGLSQPVRLTSTPFMLPMTGCCSTSASNAMGGAGMAHHR
jgi:hypothetical protein